MRSEPSLKAAVENLCSTPLNNLRDDEDHTKAQRVIDSFMKELKSIDLSNQHLDSVNDLFKSLFRDSDGYSKNLFKVLEFVHQHPEDRQLNAELDKFFEEGRMRDGLRDLLGIIDKFLLSNLDPKLPVFLSYYSESVRLRIRKDQDISPENSNSNVFGIAQ